MSRVCMFLSNCRYQILNCLSFHACRGGDAFGADSQVTILMDGNKSVQATFSSRATLQVFVRGAGEVSGVADLGSYAIGGVASLTAVPATGWEFSHWGNAASGSITTAAITMDSSKTVTAYFKLPVANWKSSHFSAAELLDIAVSGDDADPDGDGLKNWQEYLHLSDPRNAASGGGIQTKLEAGYFYTLYTRNSGADGGMSVACKASRNLSNWAAADFQERVLRTSNGVETVEARLPVSGGGKGFLQMQYIREPE